MKKLFHGWFLVDIKAGNKVIKAAWMKLTRVLPHDIIGE